MIKLAGILFISLLCALAPFLVCNIKHIKPPDNQSYLEVKISNTLPAFDYVKTITKTNHISITIHRITD